MGILKLYENRDIVSTVRLVRGKLQRVPMQCGIRTVVRVVTWKGTPNNAIDKNLKFCNVGFLDDS